MALVTHKLQGSHISFPWSSPTCTKGLILRRPVTTVHFVGRKEKHLRLKQHCRFSLGSPCNSGLKAKPFRVTSFKGDVQNSESRGSEGRNKVTNNPAKLSYRSDDEENNNVNGSSKAQNTSLSYTSETDDSITGKPAIQKLFKKWLTMLRTQSPIQAMDEALGGEQVPQTTKPETETETEIRKTESLHQSIKNTVRFWFWSLDAAITIPLLLFVPAFLAVNAIYGAEVTKELTPLWVAGPLIVALNIKIVQGLCALYAYCFNQSIKMIRKLPSYYLVAYHYITHGKLRDLVFRKVLAIKNTDYKELTRTKLKQFLEWLIETNYDFVEFVWPYYCKTVRSLKRANLI